ncbi:hypothetical protein FAIPA1_20004 [Frankia sp. AiPs1]|uniref:type II toxin-antitoxin system HicB family antitoxin n=1 Tax=Frankia sp. AiPa1 TaxID=573492 RepID=UPI00202AF971|nr:type II toxin-antitoxin system HicB family antitoxin [Frankia sp. AiPa1]MCL9759020.1 type II toxin-antitoxin system HicB family antitoxin [Frankia sp. AiPa1]
MTSPSAGRLLVVDGDRSVVASYERSQWAEAHLWAHARADEPLTRLPVYLEDLRLRATWRIDDRGCEFLTWVRQGSPETTLTCPLQTIRREASPEFDMFTVRIATAEADDGWIASVDEIPGCYAQGESMAEVVAKLAESLALAARGE